MWQDQEKAGLKWAENWLISQGYEIQAQPKILREMPWSTVAYFTTSKGRIYLKLMAQPFASEPILLRLLFNHVSKNITETIAINEQLSCFLMKDAGEPLRDIFKINFNADLFVSALKTYVGIQIESIDYVDKMLELEINDWRLEKLPFLYQKLIQQEDILKADGILPFEIEMLYQLVPRMRSLCIQLSKYCIPETIEHGDFHDNNRPSAKAFF